MADWFQEWFGDEYLALYPHRDEAEAERAVRLIAAGVRGKKIVRALDLACGAGRHARPLAENWWTVGLDLSAPLLRVARAADKDGNYVRADMRTLPFGDSVFGLAVNLFTSFGYFETDAQHRRVLAEVARVVERGGTFVLDFLNSAGIRTSLIPYDETTIGDKVVEQRREITNAGRYVQKTISVRGTGKTFVERVRLFSAEELESMLEECGFSVVQKFGDYDGNALQSASPRAILFAERE